MTLIISHLSPGYGQRSISDLLVSAPAAHDIGVQLPLKDGFDRIQRGRSIVSGVMQKTVTFGSTSISWAGSLVNALLCIKHIAQRTDSGRNLFLESQFLNFLDTEGLCRSSISILYHHTKNGRLEFWHHGANLYGKNIYAAGSGCWDFFDNVSFNPADGKDEFDIVHHNLISNAFSMFTREIVFPENYDYLYGGWFEFTHQHLSYFEKIPIAIKLWHVLDGKISAHMPLFFSHYFNHDLCVMRIFPSKRVDEPSLRVSPLLIPDLLGRPGASTAGPVGIKFAPRLLIHAVFKFSSKKPGVVFSKVFGEEYKFIPQFQISFYKGDNGRPRFGMDITPDYANKILKKSIDDQGLTFEHGIIPVL